MGAPPISASEGSEGTTIDATTIDAAGETTTRQQQLLHDSGLDLEWSSSEQSTLNEGLERYADESSNIAKYVKIAALLPDKTVRDVALRCHWLIKNEDAKRKAEEQKAAKKAHDKKENVEASSKQGQAVVPMYMAPPPPTESDDGITYEAIGGTTGKLLEQNSKVIVQIKANLSACQVQENTDLLVQLRDNITAILNGMMSMPGIMSQMPPLPVKMNSELADSILPQPAAQPSAA